MIKQYSIKSRNKKEENYTVNLTFDEIGNIIPEKTTCTCKKGSFYRFTKKNILLGKWQCFHIKEAIKKYKNGEPDIIQIEKEANDGKRDPKPIYPIF
jgi:hypothetical protein